MGFPLLDFLIKLFMNFPVLHLVHTKSVSLYAYRDRVVSVEIWLQARWSGIRISAGAMFFLFSKRFKLALERTQPPVQWTPGPARG